MRNKSLFNRKLICVHCKGYFKKRTQRNKSIYLCSRVDNYGDCKRIPVDEQFLISAIEKRVQRKLTHEEIRDMVDRVEIEDKLLFTIYLNDQEPIVYGRNQIIY